MPEILEPKKIVMDDEMRLEMNNVERARGRGEGESCKPLLLVFLLQ